MNKTLDIQFLNRFGIRLSQFKKVDTDLWRCRCPLCGDSQKHKNKTRGYFGFKEGRLCFYCHNCLRSPSFGSMLKQLDPALFQEYIFAKFKTRDTKNETVSEHLDVTKPTFPERLLDGHAIPFSNLLATHEAKRFAASRKLPGDYQKGLYFTENCQKTCEGVTGKSEDETGRKYPSDRRIIIPFLNEKKELIGFQCRALDSNSELRYVTVKLTGDRMVFGLDKVDWTKDVSVVEGPFDSMFLENSLAVAGSALLKIEFDETHAHYIFDNQPRSKEINSLMQQCIDQGKCLCVWPKSFRYKDINEAVEKGMTPQEVQGLINNHLYQGLLAKVKYSQWKKI